MCEQYRLEHALAGCDRCGAPVERTVITASGELLFCGHHWRQHENKIAELAGVMP